ncbi:MAG: response regulator, partial [Chloroflexi bacterium]
MGSPNVSVGRRAPSRWAAIDSPYGPAPMTTVGCMCLGLQPMAAAIAGHMGTAPRDSTPRPGTRLKSPESGRRPNEPSTPRGRLSPPLGKATIDPGHASASTGLMPTVGAVHPDVYARWTRSPQPVDSGGPPPHGRGAAVIEIERAIEPEPGGKTVTQTTQLARVLIADDQTLFRSGLAGLLNQDRRVSVVGQAVDGDDAVKQAATLKPDVVLMDVKMPNLDGVEATRRIVAEHPEVKILILTTFDADTFVLQALRAGASGYVLKDSQPEAIVSSVLAVLSGERVMASVVANRVLDMLTGATTPKDFYNGLTAREIEILKLMATGQANKQIARRLEISEKTVRNHVSHMYEKLQIYER